MYFQGNFPYNNSVVDPGFSFGVGVGGESADLVWGWGPTSNTGTFGKTCQTKRNGSGWRGHTWVAHPLDPPIQL